MENVFWMGGGYAYHRPIRGKRKRQQIKALILMGVLYYYVYSKGWQKTNCA